VNHVFPGQLKWADLHCHVDLYPDHETLIQECDKFQIATLAITTTPKAFKRNVELASVTPYVKVGLGLHPQLVAQRANELKLFESLLSSAQYVGEIGLDAESKYYASFDEQLRIFERILRACNEQGNKILSIHSVRSVSKVLKHLELFLTDSTCVPILHWFTGSKSEAKRAVALGCFFSINSEMVRSSKMHSLIQSLPLSRLLTETDGPFVRLDGRSTRPTDIPATVMELAAIRNIDSKAMAHQILINLRTIDDGSLSSYDAKKIHDTH
jgi:TatD DNase family protein